MYLSLFYLFWQLGQPPPQISTFSLLHPTPPPHLFPYNSIHFTPCRFYFQHNTSSLSRYYLLKRRKEWKRGENPEPSRANRSQECSIIRARNIESHLNRSATAVEESNLVMEQEGRDRSWVEPVGVESAVSSELRA